MKRFFLIALLSMATLGIAAWDDIYFEPYTSVSLRLPSVPLIMNDPFISFWSPYDKLTDGTTRHWADFSRTMAGMD